MKRAIFIALFFVLFSQVCEGQWEKIADFGYPIALISFQENSTTPSIGFVGIKIPSNTTGKLLRTTDGGFTWQSSPYPVNSYGNYVSPNSITFKDAFEGWFCNFGSNGVYHTLDGGVSWVLTSDYVPNNTSYSSYTSNVFCSGTGSYMYSSDGVNFKIVNVPGFIGGVNVTMNGRYGLLTGYGNTTEWAITSDGGITWSVITMPYSEAYSPLGIPGTSTFFAICELALDPSNPGKVIRSDDGGMTWKELYKFKSSYPYPVTGTIQLGKDGHLFFQTTPTETAGIMMSQDSGITFTSICGPTNGQDTRFYVRDSFIYAGDMYGGLWLNTTGIGSNSTPQLSKSSISLDSRLCQSIEDTILFTLFDSCNGRQATLLEASVSGSNRFALAGGAVPRTIVPNDTVRIIYTPDPNSSATEDATLNLKLKLGWKVFDTVITLTGRNITPHLDITLTPVLKANNFEAGKEAECEIYSSNRIQDRGLDKVTFDLTYDNDLLEVASITTQSGMSASYTAPIVTNGIARLPITITGNNMTIDSLAPMVTVKFRTYLTDTTLSTIELSSIQLNDDEPSYKNCTLSATGNSTTFTQASVCGDSTIRSFMLTGKLIDILSIRPNPTNANISVAFESLTDERAKLQLLDELGKVVLEETLATKRGVNEHSVVIPKHWSGTFYLRLQMGKDVVTGKFVKQ